MIFTLPCALLKSFKFSSLFVSSCEYIWEEHRTAIIVTTAVFATLKIHRAVRRKKLRAKWNSAGENVVVIHSFFKSTTCPSLSPYVMKLETYMRMAGMEYTIDEAQPFGPKGKCPWITLNGEDYADSQLIIEFLGKKYNKDFSSHLSDDQKAIARAMLIMNDEHIFCGLEWWRFVKDPDFRICDLMRASFPLRMIFQYVKHTKMPKQLWAQGIGRHSHEEVEDMIEKDIQALSLYLGNKKFLMGDTPSEVDCAVFGMLSQFVWGAPGSPFAALLQSDYRNLQNYCFRMKEKFWPDWEKRLLP